VVAGGLRARQIINCRRKAARASTLPAYFSTNKMDYKTNKILPTAVATSTEFIEFGSEDIGAIIDYMRMLIGDLMPLLTLVISVGMALIVIAAIVRAIRG